MGDSCLLLSPPRVALRKDTDTSVESCRMEQCQLQVILPRMKAPPAGLHVHAPSAMAAEDPKIFQTWMRPTDPSLQQCCPLASLLEDVDLGLKAGCTPQLTEEGSGGTYFMLDSRGRKVAVFKPMDEEPLAVNSPRGMVPSSTGEGLKAGTRVGEGAIREVAAYLLDQRLDIKGRADLCGYSGVPLTVLARCGSGHFSHAAAQQQMVHWSLADVPTAKQGSLQKYVAAVSSCEDMGPKHFSVHEVQKIAVLDMRLGNADRNGANILVQRAGPDFRLVPIDHGYCLPEALEECTFEWLYWAQSKEPFEPSAMEYIKTLDAEEDIKFLKRCGWDLSDGVARTLRACTLLLNKGAAAGLTPYDIGNLMVRADPAAPCPLEIMVEEAEGLLDRAGLGVDQFSSLLGDIIDQHLADKVSKLV